MTLKQLISMPLVTTLILCLFTVSCEEDATEIPIGEDWADSNTKIHFIDSMTVNLSTFKFDSIIVSNTSRLLVGAYTDPVVGFTKSKSYVQLNPTDFTIDDEGIYDSIALILNYDNYFYNDTIPTQQLSIYQVTEDIEYIENDYFYNTNNFEINNTPIATKSFIAQPKKDDSLHVSINYNFGKTIFDQIKENNINNLDEFLFEHKGLLIEPNNNNTAVLGFLKNSFLRIYYTVEDESEDLEETLDIAFSGTNSFHNVTNNSQDNPFTPLTDQEAKVLSSTLDNISVIQGGTGLAIHVDIPNIEKIYDVPGTGVIVDANLKLSLKKNSNTELLHTRDSLYVYILDNKSEVITGLTTSLGETALGLIDYENSEFSEETYTIPIKYFLDLKLTEINGDDLFLGIYSNDFNQSVDRYIINGESANTLNAKLEITYAIYDE